MASADVFVSPRRSIRASSRPAWTLVSLCRLGFVSWLGLSGCWLLLQRFSVDADVRAAAMSGRTLTAAVKPCYSVRRCRVRGRCTTVGRHCAAVALQRQGAVATSPVDGTLVRATQKPEFRWWSLPVDPALTNAGECLHVPEFCATRDDHRLLRALAADVERCADGAVGRHRSGKHLVVYGEALRHSKAFRALIGQILSAFDIALVDCWVNVYRGGDDMKSWHRDNYRDRIPRPTVTLGVSLGDTRDLAFQHLNSKKEYRITQGNGDLFAFDDPFNGRFMHSVPPATGVGAKKQRISADDTEGLRLSVIVWANEGSHAQHVTRKQTRGWRPEVPLEVSWSDFALDDIDLPTALAATEAVAADVDRKPDNGNAAAEVFVSNDVSIASMATTPAAGGAQREPSEKDFAVSQNRGNDLVMASVPMATPEVDASSEPSEKDIAANSVPCDDRATPAIGTEAAAVGAESESSEEGTAVSPDANGDPIVAPAATETAVASSDSDTIEKSADTVEDSPAPEAAVPAPETGVPAPPTSSARPVTPASLWAAAFGGKASGGWR